MKKNKKGGKLCRITALLLTLLMILSTLVSCGGELDLLSDDLSEYITISEADYKSFPVEGRLSEYSEDALLRKINKILLKKAERNGKLKRTDSVPRN